MTGRKSRFEIELKKEWERLLGTSGELPPARSVQQAASRGPRDTALFAELEELRLLVTRAAAQPRLERVAGRYVNAAWTVKDLLGHAAAWAAETRREIEVVARGEGFHYSIPFAFSAIGPTAWNEMEVERRRSSPLRAVLAELDQALRALQELVTGMPGDSLNRPMRFPLAPSGDPAERLRATPASIVLGQCMHLRSHIARLTAALPRLSAEGSRR